LWQPFKPDNIGIHSLNKQQNQLILYDFSLTSAPLDNLRIGTPGYTDPFLPNRKSGYDNRHHDLDRLRRTGWTNSTFVLRMRVASSMREREHRP
jgi:hypothetical protein